MTTLTQKDIDWLKRTRENPGMNVVVGGYVDECTDWIGYLIALFEENEELKRRLATVIALEVKNGLRTLDTKAQNKKGLR